MGLPDPCHYDRRSDIAVYHANCMDILPELPDSSVDLVATDPPYFKVKRDWWDRQWNKPEVFLAWIGGLCDQWQRVLKPNGSLYVFTSPQMAWGVEGEMRKRFNVLTNIRWVKRDGWHMKIVKEELRAPFPASETILFAEQYGADSMALGESGYAAQCERLRGFVFEPLRKYLAGEFEVLGWNGDRLNEICGTASMAAGHYTARSQWCLPTAEHYAKLQAAASGHLRREYEDLRREYEDLRRPFFTKADRPYTDAWNFPTVPHRPGKHPCEKPLGMMEHIIETSTRPGALVLDCFAGSGGTLVAASNLGRRAIGVEIEEPYCRKIAERLRQHPLMFSEN